MPNLLDVLNCSESSSATSLVAHRNRPKSCVPSEDADGAIEQIDHSELVRRVTEVLRDQGIKADDREEEIEDFALEIARSNQAHEQWLIKLRDPEKWFGRDIVYWITKAQVDGDFDEALWRVFLATHFGRTSCDFASNTPDSAARFLCGFGNEPYWTWQKVSNGLGGLELWLEKQGYQVATLKFGNHRKHETNSNPTELFKVLKSIVEWVERNGGTPQSALNTEGASKSTSAFRMLYRRLMGFPAPKTDGIRRFGRTACFDMLMLMADLELATIRPGSCYLTGSTGPYKAAKVVWGATLTDTALELRAETLAKRIGVPMNVVEDALCIWQK